MKYELEPYNQNTTDKDLLDDLIKIAKELNKDSLEMREYNKFGRFSSGTIAKRFNGWNNALTTVGLKITKNSNVSESELLEDIIKVAKEIAPKKLTQKNYNEIGKFGIMTISERIGWNNALIKIGLELNLQMNITDKELFENLEEVWIKIGSQPGKRDMVKPNSKYSEKPYCKKFGTWRKALEAFIDYINIDKEPTPLIIENEVFIEKKDANLKHKTKRDISERLKVMVLIRDGNKCRLCGKTVTGDDIHFDHIMPWSKGGETVFENIQVLCAPHNLAKGDYYEET